jgi:uncharacterized protein YecE (DUF72 family)
LLTHHPARSDRLPAALRAFLRPDAPAAKNIYLHHLMSQGVDLLWQMHERALAPLHEAGKLGAVLFQFPPWFHKNDETIPTAGRSYERDRLRTPARSQQPHLGSSDGGSQ